MRGRASAAVLVFLAVGCGGHPPAAEDGEKPKPPAAGLRRVTIHVKDMT
jgi:hypothetical protein